MKSGRCGDGNIPKHHQLIRFDRQQCVSTSIASREFDFESTAIIGHYNRTHLAAAQQKGRARVEIRGRNILKQRYQIMHLNLAVHNQTI